MWLNGMLILITKLGLILGLLLFVAAYLIWIERKLLARLQVRLGPNRAGKFGLLQPIADAIKLLTKEDIIPVQADRRLFLLAPVIVAITALLTFAVIPLGPDWHFRGEPVPMVISDLNIGLLYAFALAALSVYGIAVGGWASNSKYSLLGGIRGAAQMISYELSLGLSIVPVVMLAGSFSLVDIVNAQENWPFVLVQPVAMMIFLISAMAESKRLPFDLPEAENELGAGYHTEYSGMRFGLFYLGEYVQMQVLGALLAVFFLGGWRGPWLPPIVWMLIKIMLVATFMIWARATLPRMRYDHLMSFGWKVLIPIALINIVVTGAAMHLFH
jgi:NADH-quinone oxidoreductase subunit H